MACAFSPGGNFFVTGSSCGDLTVWDDKMRCLCNEKAHDLGVTCCDISSHPVSGESLDSSGEEHGKKKKKKEEEEKSVISFLSSSCFRIVFLISAQDVNDIGMTPYSECS